MAKRRVHRPEGTSAVTRGRQPGGTSRPRATSGPQMSDRRRRFERTSAPWLARMAALPSVVIPAVMGMGLFVGLVVHSLWAAIPLLLIAAFLTWLAALSWPTLSGSSRFLRLLVVVGLLGLALFKVLGKL